MARDFSLRLGLVTALAFAGCGTTATTDPPAPSDPPPVVAKVPDAAPVVLDHPDGTGPPEIYGRVVVGYQGWFTAEGDGNDTGYHHYGVREGFEPGLCTIDMWPDIGEAAPEERFPTAFRKADGTTAEVVSSSHPKTIDRHLRWMKEYDIGGAFLQRFGSALRSPRLTAFRDRVLTGVTEASTRHGVPFALMYDLSGMRAGEIESLLLPDLRRLMRETRLHEHPRYLHHKGRPLIGIWGAGFSDGRKYSLAEVSALLDTLHDESEGGWSVFLGVPYWWRDGNRDAVGDGALHDVIAKADVISPWSVGRYGNIGDAQRLITQQVPLDRAWLRGKLRTLCPVVFPGFSQHNLRQARGGSAPLGQIPRRAGAFYRAQLDAAIDAKARMIYVAMFDEVDEGTAIFKIDPKPPVGASPFLTNAPLPPDGYLRITQEAARTLRARFPAVRTTTRP